MACSACVKNLVTKLKLKVASGEEYLGRAITEVTLSRPGIELAGMFDYYEDKRIQVIGLKELAFYNSLSSSNQSTRVKKLFESGPPAFVFSRSAVIPKHFLDYSKEFEIPVLVSDLKTTALYGEIYSFLQSILALRVSKHGVLVDIDGVGVLIIGKSGLGKSEVAFELVRNGHQLIADDRVEIYQREKGSIIGEAPDILKKFLEIRGIGIVNVVELFGARAFRENKKIFLVVELELWDQSIEYDRLGLSEEFYKIIDTDVPYIKIPVTEGRNVASLVEAAALNQRLKVLGYHAAKDFTESLDRLIKQNSKNR